MINEQIKEENALTTTPNETDQNGFLQKFIDTILWLEENKTKIYPKIHEILTIRKNCYQKIFNKSLSYNQNMEIIAVDFEDNKCYVDVCSYSDGYSSHNFVFPHCLMLLSADEIESYFVDKFTRKKEQEDLATQEMLEKEKQRKIDHAIQTLNGYGYLVLEK